MTSQARLEISVDGTKIYDPLGNVVYQIDMPIDSPVVYPAQVQMCDSEEAAYKAGFNKGYREGYADCAEGTAFRGDIV